MSRRRVAVGIAAVGLLTGLGAVCEMLLRYGRLQRDIERAWSDYERSLGEVTRLEEMRVKLDVAGA